MSLMTVIGLAILIGLGLWQLDRMDQKTAATARYEALAQRDAVSLDMGLCQIRSSAAGRTMIMPDALSVSEIRLFGRAPDGRPGWRLFNTTPKPDCLGNVIGEALLIETGFETMSGEQLEPTRHITLEWLPESSAFDAPNSPETVEFHHVDLDAMATALGVDTLVSDYWLVAAGEGLPQYLSATPPSRHFGYALTWFGLALALAGIFIAYHVSKNRLGFTRR